MDAKIDVESDVVLNLVKSYKDVNNDLETMASGCKKPDIPKCLDIGSNIDGLMGVVQNAEAKLGTKMLDVVGVLNDTIDILKKSDGFDLVELYHIEDNFDIKYNGGDFVEQILKDEAKITMEEFIDLLNCSDSMFSNLYDEIKKDFQNKLILEHQSFLMNKEPKIINGLIESIYVSNTKYKIGTEDFKKGLEDFKNTFANFVLSNNVDYPHDDKYMKDESNIPSNMWFGEEIADYDKALLLLSFGKQDIIGYNIGNFCRGYENNNFEYKYDTFEYSDSFQTLINANNWFNNDFENYDIKQIVSDYQALLEGLTSSANSNAEGVINIINSAAGKSLDKDLWIYALDENHYLDSMYRNNPNLTTEDIVQNTFNGSYLSNVYSEYGIDGLNSLLGTYFDSILDDKDLGLKSCLSNGLLAKLSNVNCFENVYRSISVPTEDYISKKLELDRSKENFNMALARSLDTSNVTHKDRGNALIYLGDNAKYLELWQIDTYALLWNKNTNIDFEKKYLKALDDKVYYNTVASGKGYDAAIEQLESMNLGTLYSGNEILKIIGDILGEGYSIAGGLYDGILNSIKGVARLVTADGIMSVDDYRQSYLQELLSTDFRIYTDYYNKNSANHDYVVNMLSNNYDLDNLSKYKDKNGMNIFDSEYLKKAEENNLTLYEMLYQKGYINQDEYLKYYNLDQRKNDGNMWLYSRLGENLVFKDIGKWTYNTSSGVGNMVIPMALSAFVHPAAMSAWMFASVTGNEREQLLLSGKNNDLGTYLQAASKGLMAVGTEKFLGALTGYGAKADDILSVFKMDNSLMTKFMSTGFGKTFAKVLSNQVNESVEELVENVGNHLIDLIADGTIPDGNALWKEAWMTVLTTFATTPLINLMGEGMQGSKYSYGNRMHTHTINGFDVEYSNNELAQFTKDGVLDYEGFVKYLTENNRFNSKVEYLENVRIDVDRKTSGDVYPILRTVQLENGMQDYQVIKITREQILQMASNGMLDVLLTNADLSNEKIGEFSANEIEKAIWQMLNNNNARNITDNLEIADKLIKIRNASESRENLPITGMNDILSKEIIGNLSNNEISEMLNSDLDKEVRNYLLENLLSCKKGLKYLIENDWIKGIDGNISYNSLLNSGTVPLKKLLLFITDNSLNLNEDFNTPVLDNLTIGDVSNIVNGLIHLNGDYTNLFDKHDRLVLSIINQCIHSDKKVTDYILWANTEALDIMRQNPYIDPNKVDKAFGKIYFYDKKRFNDYLKMCGYKLFERTNVAAQHVGDGSVHIKVAGSDLYSTILHELTHDNGELSEIASGLDEAFTEYNAKKIAKENGYTEGASGYDVGVKGLRRLMQTNIPGLTEEDFSKAYFKDKSFENIRLAIDSLMGLDYFDKTFKRSFDGILNGYDPVTAFVQDVLSIRKPISKVVNDIIYEYNRQCNWN